MFHINFTKGKTMKTKISLWSVRLGGILFAIIVFCGVLLWNYGSVQNVLRVTQTEVVLLEPEILDIGTITVAETIGRFRCINTSDKPVHLLGGSSDCPCVILYHFPQTIPPKGELILPVKIRATSLTYSDISHKFIIYTNANKDFYLVGRIIGKFDIPIQ
jgi:hypothetical protein